MDIFDKKTDVLEQIKKEHEKFRDLIKQIEEASGSSKKSIFETLKMDVSAHHKAEEAVVFPDVKSKSDEDGQEIVREMIEEHNLSTYQMSLLDRTSVDNETWDAKFAVLKEVLTHHMDEEEKELFKQAKKVLTKDELAQKYGPFEKKEESAK
ncbi:MAG: hemerythrin domain-containing protein [Clostridiales bacterium]|nr:hemerythrin domain-containing protein [Clostridiales bacterium]